MHRQRIQQPSQAYVVSNGMNETQQDLNETLCNSYLVKDYMIEVIRTIDEEATVDDAVKVMTEDDCDQGYVIILKKGKPVGIVTLKDIIAVLAKGIPFQGKVKNIMTVPLITIDPDQDLMIASKVMKKNNLQHIPVVKMGIIYGIITAKIIVDKFINYVNKSIRDIVRFTSFNGFMGEY